MYPRSNNSQSLSSNIFPQAEVGADRVVGADADEGDVDVPRSQITCALRGRGASQVRLSRMEAAPSRFRQVAPRDSLRSGTLTTQTFINATTIGMFVFRVGLTLKTGTRR